MQAFGNGIVAHGHINLTANPPAADVLRVMRIRAGTKVSALMLGNSDMDTDGAPTFVFGIGYAPVVSADGPAASAAYFQAAGDTSFQAANAGKLYHNFAPITFEKDVYLTMTVGTAAATFAAGSAYVTALGVARGIK